VTQVGHPSNCNRHDSGVVTLEETALLTDGLGMVTSEKYDRGDAPPHAESVALLEHVSRDHERRDGDDGAGEQARPEAPTTRADGDVLHLRFVDGVEVVVCANEPGVKVSASHAPGESNARARVTARDAEARRARRLRTVRTLRG